METTLTRKKINKTFQTSRSEIDVEPCGNLFRITCRVQSWHVTKVLSRHKAASFILWCTKKKTKTQLAVPVKAVCVKLLATEEENFKLNGADWMLTSMAHGVKPVILKAPKLFGRRVIYIEPTPTEGIFSLRVIDPLTDHRTEGVEITGDVADEAVRVFGGKNKIK